MSRIITISRQFGSGGRTIGKLVAEKLGVRCYDKELIEKTAEETGYANEYIEQEAEYAPGTGFLHILFSEEERMALPMRTEYGLRSVK